VPEALEVSGVDWLCYHRTMRVRVAVFVLALGAVAAGPPDSLATARRLYNQGLFDQALAAARDAEGNPATVSSARLVIGRVRLERYRQTADSADLTEAQAALRTLDSRALDRRERIELQIGLAELLYFDDRFGASAEMLEPLLESTTSLGSEAHDHALDWWATALDRQAQAQATDDRESIYSRIAERMDAELRRDPASSPATYWTAAAARGIGDLDRAMAVASAGWVRAVLARDRGAALRADLDRLVTQAIIPDRASRLNTRDRRQAAATMTSEWEAFKSGWTK
jgi:hypothetical protein